MSYHILVATMQQQYTLYRFSVYIYMYIFQAVDEFVVSRFYLTLMLHRLWRQHSVWDVAARFQLSRGFIQQLLTGAGAFAAGVTQFCQVCWR